MQVNRHQKATLSKGELMYYLGIGEIKLNRLLMNPSFPRQKPILEKWSKVEIDKWLTGSSEKLAKTEQTWEDYLY